MAIFITFIEPALRRTCVSDGVRPAKANRRTKEIGTLTRVNKNRQSVISLLLNRSGLATCIQSRETTKFPHTLIY